MENSLKNAVSQSPSSSRPSRLRGKIYSDVIRIREILDPDLRQRILSALANRRGCSIAAIPDWFELDDADYVDLLNDLKNDDQNDDRPKDPRM